jgi:hypothetical protein
MDHTNGDLETMSCEELLRELAHLTASSDALNAEVATPEQAAPEQELQVTSLIGQRQRIDHIGELITAKRCAGTTASA